MLYGMLHVYLYANCKCRGFCTLMLHSAECTCVINFLSIHFLKIWSVSILYKGEDTVGGAAAGCR